MVLKNFDKLKSFLNQPRKIVVVGHRNPDGDALGSSLALKFYLEKKGHQARVVMPNRFPDFISWLPEANQVLNHETNTVEVEQIFADSDLVFLLDFNALHRVGSRMQLLLENYSNEIALIDHHQQPDEFEYMYSDTSICSTCQMVYNFIEMQSDVVLIDKVIATCIYTGIMTDTGSFRFRSTTSRTHQIAADLIDKGAENDKIHSNTFDSKSYGSLQLLGCALSNLVLLEDCNTAFITLTEKEKSRFNFKKGDTEGIVNYALSVEGVNFGVIFIEDAEQGIIKISFRSKGEFSVNKFARNHFEGGGHDNASGGKSLLSMDDTIIKFKGLVSDYANQIINSYEK